MYASFGVGLAASQVGINQTMIVVDIGSGLYKLINPKVVKREGQQINQEGCLSVPNICINIKRAKKVVVLAKDENGKPLNIEAQDLLACVLQHEIDHLKGKLIIDYASLLDRLKIGKTLRQLKSKSKSEELSESKNRILPIAVVVMSPAVVKASVVNAFFTTAKMAKSPVVFSRQIQRGPMTARLIIL